MPAHFGIKCGMVAVIRTLLWMMVDTDYSTQFEMNYLPHDTQYIDIQKQLKTQKDNYYCKQMISDWRKVARVLQGRCAFMKL